MQDGPAKFVLQVVRYVLVVVSFGFLLWMFGGNPRFLVDQATRSGWDQGVLAGAAVG